MTVMLRVRDAVDALDQPKEKLVAGLAGGVAAFTCCYTAYKLCKIWTVRNRRVKKIKENQAMKRDFEKLVNRQENKDILQRVEQITSLSLVELQSKLNSGELKPAECLLAYQAKAIREDAKYNFVTEYIQEATDEAQQLDPNQSKGLLYGVPVSVKDMFFVKGYESCCGMSKYIGVLWPEDSVLVKVLKKQGAIPFMKTNVPQTMYSFACDNPIYGQTKNPCNPAFSPGGSTGGEAAALAAKATILGFGSDIGGSCRIPACYCGVCGLKCSANRISKKGVLPFYAGNTAIKSCLGPLARDVDSLVIALKAVLVPYMFKLDPDVVPLPFRDEIYNSQKPLKIGYFVDCGLFPICPASQRAVMLAKQSLERLGHEVVLWEPKDFFLATARFWTSRMFADQGAEYVETLKYDKIAPCIKLLYRFLSMPSLMKKLLPWLIKAFDSTSANVLKGLCGFQSISEMFESTIELEKWRETNIHDWNLHGLDAVICPGSGPALPIGYPERASHVAALTSVFNILNFTAGVLPVTTVTREDEDGMKHFPSSSLSQKMAKQGLSKNTVGLPVNVQVVTLPYHEEQCLRVMKDIEKSLKDQ